MVNHQDMEHALTFYKSQVTGRWWMEVPVIKTGRQMIVPAQAKNTSKPATMIYRKCGGRLFRRSIRDTDK